jgi:hypothetical protein
MAVHFVLTRRLLAQQGRLRSRQQVAEVARLERTAWLARHPALFRQPRAQLGPTRELHPPAFFALRALLMQTLAERHPRRVRPAQRESSAKAARFLVQIALQVGTTPVRAGVRQTLASHVWRVGSTQPRAPPMPVCASSAQGALTTPARAVLRVSYARRAVTTPARAVCPGLRVCHARRAFTTPARAVHPALRVFHARVVLITPVLAARPQQRVSPVQRASTASQPQHLA